MSEDLENAIYFLFCFAWGLTLLLILGKLFNKIDWSWIIVSAPIVFIAIIEIILSVIHIIIKIKKGVMSEKQ